MASLSIGYIPLGQTEFPGLPLAGYYIYHFVAVSSPSDAFGPNTTFIWTVDGQQYLIGQNGSNQAQAQLLVGSAGQPLVYTYTIGVTANEGGQEVASATYTLKLPQLQGTLSWAADPGSKNQVSVYRWDSSPGNWIETTVTTFSKVDAVVEGLANFFLPWQTPTWAPQPTGLANQGFTAIYAMNGQAFLPVSVTITDAIGQTLNLAVDLPSEIAKTTHGPDWTPPQLPGKGVQNLTLKPTSSDLAAAKAQARHVKFIRTGGNA